MKTSRESERKTRAMAVLRDVIACGGRTNWAHLAGHGYSFSTVWSCVNRGWLSATGRYDYEVTSRGYAEAAQTP